MSRSIQPQKNKEENSKSTNGRTSVTEKRQGNPNHRHQTDYHSYIDGDVNCKDRSYRITVDTTEVGTLFFRKKNQPDY
jgi:hypothetical protein